MKYVTITDAAWNVLALEKTLRKIHKLEGKTFHSLVDELVEPLRRKHANTYDKAKRSSKPARMDK